MSDLDTDLKQIDNKLFEQHGLEMKGELYAAMLDAKRTFDDLIDRHSPDSETRDQILDNRIYQELSNAVAGSQEYMAMEKLLELHETSGCDLLVLDTGALVPLRFLVGRDDTGRLVVDVPAGLFDLLDEA